MKKAKFINFISSYWIVFILGLTAIFDIASIEMFFIFGKTYLTFNTFIQPLLFFGSVILYLHTNKSLNGILKMLMFIFAFIFFFAVRSFADIPSNISMCPNGKIEIQKITFTGAGYRYYLGENKDEAKKNWGVMGFVRDDCGVVRKN
jgi:hypothetical protein